MTDKTEMETMEFETINFEVTEDPGYVFEGVEIATTSDYATYNDISYTTLMLYKTKAGTRVCRRDWETRMQGSTNTTEAAVCKTNAEIIAFFGQCDLAHNIYRDADIDNAIVID